jgi:hypothetical protein
MGHGADPFHVQLSRKTLDTLRINAVRFAQQNRTGQPWVKPGHDIGTIDEVSFRPLGLPARDARKNPFIAGRQKSASEL